MMIVISVISLIAGLGFLFYGIHLNNDMESVIGSLFESGNAAPGEVFIFIGILALVVGAVLLFLTVFKNKKQS